MYKDLKYKAEFLRKKGSTYYEINKILKTNIPKSTLSTWFKNINLTFEQKIILEKVLKEKSIESRKKALTTNKNKRIKYLEGLKMKNLFLLKNLDLNVQKSLLSILYLGEGAKSKSTGFLSLASSNFKITKLYLKLLTNCFLIDQKKFRVRIQARSDQDVAKLIDYWQNITQIPLSQFYPTYIDKRTISKTTTHTDYKGVCTVYYFDRSIQLELEILANSMIEYLTK